MYGQMSSKRIMTVGIHKESFKITIQKKKKKKVVYVDSWNSSLHESKCSISNDVHIVYNYCNGIVITVTVHFSHRQEYRLQL